MEHDVIERGSVPARGSRGHPAAPRRVLVAGHRGGASRIALALRRVGFQVDEPPDPAFVPAAVEAGDYSAIVLQREAPDGTAFALVDELRARGRATPIVLLDRAEDESECLRAFALGVDDYAAVTRSTDELVYRVVRPACAAGAWRPPRVRVGPLLLDRSRRQVRRGDRRVRLSAKEYAVFEHLVTADGRVVTREELIEHCWCNGLDTHSNIVDTKVAALRTKLGCADVFVTVRGVGYRLGTPYCSGAGRGDGERS